MIEPTHEPMLLYPLGREPEFSGDTRWDVGFLVGPCTQEQAVALLEELTAVVAGRLGAAGSVVRWAEDDE